MILASAAPISPWDDSPEPIAPATRPRIVVALVLGVLCGLISWYSTTHIAPLRDTDFGYWWEAAQALLHHQNPYKVVLYKAGALAGTLVFHYPLPTAIATIPFTVLPVQIASAVFVAGSCGLLAFAVTARAWWPLLMFASGAMVMMIICAQASALMAVAVMMPSMTWLGMIKPNYGFAILAYRPSWKAAVVMLAIAAASIAVLPSWPRDWAAGAMQSQIHFSPWRVPGGLLLFLSLLRWRRPEARMLAMIALVPGGAVAYDALIVFTVAESSTEMLVLAISSTVMVLLMASLSLNVDPAAYIARAGPAMLWLIYIPALVMILRRPNVGALPEWILRLVPRLRETSAPSREMTQ